MIVYLYCGKCSRAFAAKLRSDDDTPQSHSYELLTSDLKRVEHGRPYVGCAYKDCGGSLEQFLWWRDARAQAEQRHGVIWPEEPIYGVKYRLRKFV